MSTRSGRARFGSFELCEQRRELRLDEREVALQPRVFDLLVYLLRHRDRVVSKGELLDALWPDVIVADGALQRAVSLARSALRAGGVADAIRTFPRKGYRFCAEVSEVSEVSEATIGDAAAVCASSDAGDGDGQGRRLQGRGETAYDRGDLADALEPFERAVAAYVEHGELAGAARCALWLAHIQLERREVAVARGWHRRAAQYLDGVDELPEHARLVWLSSRFATFEGEQSEALVHAERAHAIARRVGDADLEAVTLLYRGFAMQALGEVVSGVALQDEAATAVLGSEVSGWAGGVTFCGVIYGCLNRGDLQRATLWTDHFGRWCSRSGVGTYPGLCRLHRAEVLVARGELGEAAAEVIAARDELARAAPWAEGNAYRVLGDVRLRQGELDAAAKALHRAYQLGWDPQPWLAFVHLERGRADSAQRELQHSLQEAGWDNQQRRALLLASLVEVAVSAGDLDAAREASAELERRPQLWSTPTMKAHVLRACAELQHAEGASWRALAGLRQAARLYRESRAPLEQARVHMRAAELLDDGDHADRDAARLELATAERLLAERASAPLTARCQRLRARLPC